MKTRKNLSHSHELSEAGTVTAYDGWRESVTITLRDEGKEGQEEVTIELPNNLFAKLVERLDGIVKEREADAEKAAADELEQQQMRDKEESEVE